MNRGTEERDSTTWDFTKINLVWVDQLHLAFGTIESTGCVNIL